MSVVLYKKTKIVIDTRKHSRDEKTKGKPEKQPEFRLSVSGVENTLRKVTRASRRRNK